jgi:hypothetical protein
VNNKLSLGQWVIALLLCCLPAMHTYGANLCPPTRTTVGFFNGVWNTEWQARQSQELVHGIFENNVPLTGEPISYRLFYNDTVGTFEPYRTVLGGPLQSARHFATRNLI